MQSRARGSTRVAYQRRQLLTRATVTSMLGTWARVDPAHIRTSWQELLATAVTALNAAQATAVTQATVDAERMILDAGATPRPQAHLQPDRLTGIASDGRSLTGLLLAPAMLTRARLAAGMPVAEALRSGAVVLTRITATQITDAGRVATGMRLLVDQAVSGYVRRIEPPACDRCIIQDGKWFATNTGFKRHPHCDCEHEPVLTGQQPPEQDLRGLLDQMSTPQLTATFGPGVAQRIRDGADPARLVDAAAGMAIAGTSSPDGRVMPEALYAASTSRAHAVALLRQHGYLT